MFRLRQPDPEGKFCAHLKLQALARFLPQALIHQVLAEQDALARRERKLSMEAVVWVVIAMNLFVDCSIAYVLEKLAHGARFLGRDPAAPLPRGQALTYRRDLGQIDELSSNVKDALSWQSVTETALGKMSDVIQRARELLVQGGNDSNGPVERESIAKEIDQLLETVKTEANASYAGRST